MEFRRPSRIETREATSPGDHGSRILAACVASGSPLAPPLPCAGSLASTTFDRAHAIRAVLEGEATFYQYRAAVPLLGLDIGTIDFRGALSERLREDIGDAFYADTPIGASYNTFPYGWGAPLAFETWLADGGPRGLDALWASPPNTTQQVISLRPELPSQLATNHGPEPQTRYGAPWLRFGFGHCWG